MEPGDLSLPLDFSSPFTWPVGLGHGGGPAMGSRARRGSLPCASTARVCRYAAGGAGLRPWATAGGLWAVTDRDRRVDKIRRFFLPSVLIYLVFSPDGRI